MGEGANEGVKGKAGGRGWLLSSAAGSGLELEVWGGLRRPLTWASCSHSGPSDGLARPGLAYRTGWMELGVAKARQSSWHRLLLARSCGWGKAGLTQSECKDGDAGSSRGGLGKGVGSPGAEMR